VVVDAKQGWYSSIEFGQGAKNSLLKEAASYDMLESLWLAVVKTIKNVRCEVLTPLLTEIQVFWDITLCWIVNSFWDFKDTKCLHLCNPANNEEILPINYWILKMEAASSSKISVTTYRMTKHHNPEDWYLHCNIPLEIERDWEFLNQLSDY